MGDMSSLAKMLIMIGIILVVGGLAILLLGRFINIGRLPGDIFIQKENGSFYFPVVSCIIISIVLSVILNLFNKH